MMGFNFFRNYHFTCLTTKNEKCFNENLKHLEICLILIGLAQNSFRK